MRGRDGTDFVAFYRFARQTFIEANLRLVSHVGKAIFRRDALVRAMGWEDVIAYGSVGLIKAVDKFDPTRGGAFSTYAYRAIYNEIKQSSYLTKTIILDRNQYNYKKSTSYSDALKERIIEIINGRTFSFSTHLYDVPNRQDGPHNHNAKLIRKVMRLLPHLKSTRKALRGQKKINIAYTFPSYHGFDGYEQKTTDVLALEFNCSKNAIRDWHRKTLKELAERMDEDKCYMAG